MVKKRFPHSTPVVELEFSVRAANCLQFAQIHTLGDAHRMPLKLFAARLAQHRRGGEKDMAAVTKELRQYGVRLGAGSVVRAQMMWAIEEFHRKTTSLHPQTVSRTKREAWDRMFKHFVGNTAIASPERHRAAELFYGNRKHMRAVKVTATWEAHH